MSTPAERKSDLIARDLLRQIAHGDVAPGDTLPTEAALAERYGVNRSVVREANKLLEVHGLVQPVRRRGTVVLDPAGSLSPMVMHALLVDAEGQVNPEVLADFIEIRAELDVLMYGLAAARRTDDDLAVLEQAVVRLGALVDEPAAYGREASAFALAVAAASHNRLFVTLARWHQQVYDDFEELFSLTRQATVAHCQGCRMLIEAIRAREVELARRLVRGFHDWVRETLLASARKEHR
ncbi:MAG: FadR family transcriptional regulator [Myxococcales bacterium]|nr:FadR family transcriptional regulator [Myxococcales bacterium]MCB9548594.1 FadR family transcriptional regulator [Myxococcales bacterium]